MVKICQCCRQSPQKTAERQTKLGEFTYYDFVRYEFVPIKGKPKSRVGLAERFLRKRLEKQGWMVWRGGSIDITRRAEVYPNVRRRYEQLCALLEQQYPTMLEKLQYLCVVHHGMPDFVCYRRGEFKFVECKLGHESLSERQKKCIVVLQKLGFVVEVHKLVDTCTKTRIAVVDLYNGQKIVVETQLSLRRKI